MPRRRAATLMALATALAAGDLDLSPGADRVCALDALRRLPGIGPWTIASVAMRALGDPDAFLATDLGVAAAGRLVGLTTTRELIARSERWRPWRSYATQVLWGLLDHPINRLPGVAGNTDTPYTSPSGVIVSASTGSPAPRSPPLPSRTPFRYAR